MNTTWLCAVIFPFLMLLLIGNALVFDTTLYNSLLRPGAVRPTMQVLDYFQGKAVVPGIFDAREKEHLTDVKDVILLLRWISLVLLILFLALMTKADASKVFIMGFWLLVILALLSGFIPFDTVFEKFHQTFFSDGSYLFPANSMLIIMYPAGFFQAFFSYIVSLTLAYSASFFLLGYILQKQKA
jgi:integral membrane protein (TIGR01906 family)